MANQPKQIEVIVPDRQVLDLNAMSETEREVIFDELMVGLGQSVGILHLDSFRLSQETIAKRTLSTTTIPEIVLRNAVELASQVADLTRWQILVMKVPGFYADKTLARAPATRAKPVSGQHEVTGGVVSLMSKGLKKALKDIYRSDTADPNALRVRFSHHIPAKTADATPQPYTIPEMVEQPILGVFLIYPGGLNIHVPQNSPSVDDLTKSGAYNYSLLYYRQQVRKPTLMTVSPRDIAAINTWCGGVLDSALSAAAVSRALHAYRPKPTTATAPPRSALTFATPLSKMLSGLFQQAIPDSPLYAYSQAFPLRGGDSVLSAYARGFDDPATKQLVAGYRNLSSVEQLESSIRLSSNVARYRNALFRWVASKILDSKRFAVIVTDANRAAESLEQHVTASELKIISSEIKRREQLMKSLHENKCPHVKLLAKFRTQNFDYQSKIMFTDLLKMTVPVKSTKASTPAMLTCKQCGWDILCPHVVELANLLYSNQTTTVIKEALTKYIDTAISNWYYCKVCGEAISEADAFSDTLSAAEASTLNNISDDLRKSMYSETSYALRQFTIGPLVPTNKLILSCISIIHEYVQEVERQLYKSKVNTADDLKNKRTLFITIYAYAFLTFVSLSSRGRKDAPQITIRGLEKSAKPADYVKQAIRLIISTKNIVLNKIPAATNEFLKDKFLEAYKNVSNKSAQISISKAHDPESTAAKLLLDPIFWYGYYVYRVREGKADQQNPLKSATRVVGFDISGTRPHQLYAKLYQPASVTSSVDSLYALKSAATVKYRLLSRKEYNALSGGLTYAGYIVWTSRISSGLSKIPVSVETDTHPEHLKYIKAAARVVTSEITLRGYLATTYARNPIRPAVDPKHILEYIPHELPIGMFYDETGLPHAWTIFVYSGGVETAPSKASTLDVSGGPIDKKCSECGVKMSETASLDASKINSAVIQSDTIGSILKWYLYRCPKGDSHEFGKGTVCSKCQLDLEWATAYDFGCPKGGQHDFAVKRDKFVCRSCDYDFHSVYNVAKMKLASAYALGYSSQYTQESSVVSTVPSEPPAKFEIGDFADQYETYAFNYNVLLELSQVASVNVNLISVIGATGGVDYSTVLNGTYVPEEPYHRDSTRIYRVHTYTSNGLMEYNQLRFASSFVKMPAGVAEVLTGVPRDLVEKLRDLLPDAAEGYRERFEWFRKNKKPREILDFAIEQFATRLLLIARDKTPQTAALRLAFVKRVLGNVIKEDRLLSRAGDFNWALIRDGDIKESEGYNENLDPEFNDKADDDDKEEGEDVVDTSQPFRNGYDIDTMGETGETGDEAAVLEDHGMGVAVEGYDDIM